MDRSASTPKIYDNIIVWSEYKNINSRYVTYTKVYNITSKTISQINEHFDISKFSLVDISKNKILRIDKSSGTLDMYIHNLSDNSITSVYSDLKMTQKDYSFDFDQNYIVVNENKNSNFIINLFNISDGKITTISSGPKIKFFPRISNNIIIWYDYREGKHDIYYYNISTGGPSKKLTTLTGYSIQDIVFNSNRLIWSANDGGTSDIYVYDLSKNLTTRLTHDSKPQRYPDIHKNKIVWADQRHANISIGNSEDTDIYMHDIGPPECCTDFDVCTKDFERLNGECVNEPITTCTNDDGCCAPGCGYYTDNDCDFGEPLIATTNNETYPAFHDNKLTYSSYNATDNIIMIKDFSNSKTTEIINEWGAHIPKIFEDKLVWQVFTSATSGFPFLTFCETGGPDFDVFAYDLTTQKTLASFTDCYSQTSVDIHDNIITYQYGHMYNGITKYSIVIHNLSNNQQIKDIVTSENEQHPSIYKDSVVWLSDRNSTSIYMYNITANSETKLPTKREVVGIHPHIYKNHIVWVEKNIGTGINKTLILYDINTNTTKEIIRGFTSITNPMIYEDTVVWADDRNFYGKRIYAYNIITNEEHELSRRGSDIKNLYFYDNKVFWTIENNNNYDIYWERYNSSLNECIKNESQECEKNECVPTGSETCDNDTGYDSLDNNCDGKIDLDCDNYCDKDGDGYTPRMFPLCLGHSRGDCDDNNALIKPGVNDTCDGINNDCNQNTDDGSVETWFNRPTVCGTGACSSEGVFTCINGNKVNNCAPRSPNLEICNNIDDNCNGEVDEGLTKEVFCGLGVCFGNNGFLECNNGIFEERCNILKGASPELCDGVLDENCDGNVDEGCNCVSGEVRTCGTSDIGLCKYGTQSCVNGEWGACLGDTGPTSDNNCDGHDNNCDGKIDEGYLPILTNCGVGECSGNLGQLECVNGEKVDNCDPFAGSSLETCDTNTGYDGLDNNCDGKIDLNCDNYCDKDGDGYTPRIFPLCFGHKSGDCDDNNKKIWQKLDGYIDSDKDSYGSGDSLKICSGKTLFKDYINISGDCDNNDKKINPNSKEICDGKDNNCDGTVDENNADCSEDSPFCSLGRCVECSIDNDCDNRLYCDGIESCSPTGSCEAGNFIDCSDNKDDTYDFCNESTNDCQFPDIILDEDSDNIPDSFDKCPNTASEYKEEVNKKGCPTPDYKEFDFITNLTNTNLKEIKNFKIGKEGIGKIKFKENISLVKELDTKIIPLNLSFITISKGRIEVNSNELSELNMSAELEMNGLNLTNPRILKDGIFCRDCTITLWNRTLGTLTFDVSGFSIYEAVEAFCGDSFCDNDIGEDCSTCSLDCDSCPTSENIPTNSGNSNSNSRTNNREQNSTLTIQNLTGSNCTQNWICSDWADCFNDKQTRKCSELNNCQINLRIPQTEKDCTNATIQETPKSQKTKSPTLIYIIISLFLIILIIILSFVIKKILRKNSKIKRIMPSPR